MKKMDKQARGRQRDEELQTDQQTGEHLLPQVGGHSHLIKPAPAHVYLDWDEVITEGCMTYHLRVSRWDLTNVIDFAIDLNKLGPDARDRLDSFLARRQAGLRDDRDLAWHLSWLLETWLMQVQPALETAARQLEVRRLLLAEPLPETAADPIPNIGISPLLVCLDQQARNSLSERHHIDIAVLETESFKLSRELDEYKKTAPASDVSGRAAFTEKLLTHHRRVKQVGEWAGGQVGDALVTYAEHSIEGLSKHGL